MKLERRAFSGIYRFLRGYKPYYYTTLRSQAGILQSANEKLFAEEN
jgi:hypothetical protein